MSNVDIAAREIIKTLLLLKNPTHNDINRIKTKIAAKYHLDHVLSNPEIIFFLKKGEKVKLLSVLRRKSVRTISGVTVVAVMTKPHPCPQPEPCAYCPGGPSIGSPQSYTGHEPAAMRGEQNNYDPYAQVRSRIDQLNAIGHKIDKIELIIMGGTFPSTPIEYQTWFIKRCLDAITLKSSSSLDEAKKNAEQSTIRNVGITVETRPDWAKKTHIDIMLEMGVTRVELGVQNPNDALYERAGRMHSVEDVQEATQALKDAGLKIVYHLMPGMPGSNYEQDLDAFNNVFTDSNYKPDMIKIYPCLVIDKTKTYQWYKEGKYAPYTTEEAISLIADIKKNIPPWIRVMRVQRDIPARLIIEGVKKSNLRQLVHQRLIEHGKRCRCIRCREVGHRLMVEGIEPNLEKIIITSTTYEASGGKEIFIAAEDQESDVLIGYLRLRIPSKKAHRPEITAMPSAIVRELHVYGPLVQVGKRSAEAWQHKGYGAILLKEAEHIAKETYNVKKLLVISALGTKKYYVRFGYEHDGPYISKIL